MDAETPVFFRRDGFYGDFAGVAPKWHVLKDEPDSKWGVYTAACGYSRSNILGELKISRAKKRKAVADTCGKCVAAIGGKPISDAELAARPRRPRKPVKSENPRWVLDEATGKVVQA